MLELLGIALVVLLLTGYVLYLYVRRKRGADASLAGCEKTAVLDSEIQAQVLDAILTDRGIPHVIHSHYSRAYDGVFQTSLGWGHVEAPPRFREEILAVLQEMSRVPPASEAGSATEG